MVRERGAKNPKSRPQTRPRFLHPHQHERSRRAGRAFEPEQASLIEPVWQLLAAVTPNLGRWLSLGWAWLTVAMLHAGPPPGYQPVFVMGRG
jgi:hypothetical protein